MSIIDKAVAALTPPETEQDRTEARARAEQMAQPGDWLSQILQHHREIEAQFDTLGSASGAEARSAAQKKLATLLTGHAIAEEAAIYPGLAATHHVAHAELAYQEQSAAKMELGLLERLDPMSEDYNDKLEHIRGAVLHHIYSEEGTWFPELMQEAGPQDLSRMAKRYQEEYARYIGDDGASAGRMSGMAAMGGSTGGGTMGSGAMASGTMGSGSSGLDSPDTAEPRAFTQL